MRDFIRLICECTGAEVMGFAIMFCGGIFIIGLASTVSP